MGNSIAKIGEAGNQVVAKIEEEKARYEARKQAGWRSEVFDKEGEGSRFLKFDVGSCMCYVCILSVGLLWFAAGNLFSILAAPLKWHLLLCCGLLN